MDIVEATQQVEQRLAVLLTEGAGIHSGKHNLQSSSVMLGGYATGSAEGLFYGGATRTAACQWDCAIGAEVVAAVLYLEKDPRATGVSGYIPRIAPRIGKHPLAAVAVDGRNARHCGNLVVRGFSHTAYHHHLGTGILRHRLTYGVATFLFGNGGNGAGIDYVEVGHLAETDNLVTFGSQTAKEVGCFGEVEFASQRMCGYLQFSKWA